MIQQTTTIYCDQCNRSETLGIKKMKPENFEYLIDEGWRFTANDSEDLQEVFCPDHTNMVDYSKVKWYIPKEQA